MELSGIGIYKSFGEVKALRGVDFTVRSGEIVGLLGENGAGKSTLARILSGIYSMDSGEVNVDGRKVNLKNPRAAWKEGICYVPQYPYSIPPFKVKEFTWLISGKKEGVEIEKFESCRNIEPGSYCWKLDVAQLSIIYFLSLLEREPRFIFIDESFSNFPKVDKKKIFELIEELRERGKGIVYITHKIDDARKLSDRIVVMRSGRIAGEYERGVEREELIEAMFGGKFSRVKRKKRRVGGRCARVDWGEGSVEIGRGEIYGVWGISGNGQREIFRGIAEGKYVDIARGEIAIGSSDFRDVVAPGMSAFENFLLGFRERYGEYRKRQDFFEKIAEKYGIAGRAEQCIDELSGGNIQKVILSRAVESARKLGKKLLVLYNPMLNLDAYSRELFWQEIHRISERGVGVLVFTEDEEDVGYCDRVGVIRRRRIVYEDVVERFDVERAYREMVI